MNKYSSTESSYSIDSLDEEFKRKSKIKDGDPNLNVDTILVPFYDKDVLIKVSKHQRNMKQHKTASKHNKYSEKQKLDGSQRSFLINKDKKNSKHKSYLEMFRKQFSPNYKDANIINDEIRSLSPEVGDTERGSICEVLNDVATEFFNTESYNEMYYEKLLNNDYAPYFENSLEELRLTDEARSKSPNELNDNNFRSNSEVTQRRRRLRRVTVEPIGNVKLGGLGPDVEKNKPSLERAKSLQRYSEKVRMENRVRIYKKSIKTDKEHKERNERDTSARYSEQRNSARNVSRGREDGNTSNFLVNKNIQDKTSKLPNTLKFYKSKSANVYGMKNKATEKNAHSISASKKRDSSIPKHDIKNSEHVEKKTEDPGREKKIKLSAKSLPRNKSKDKSKENSTDIPPVHINFMVNVGGIRPSSALKTLEEKHRMYQEQIRSFKMETNM